MLYFIQLKLVIKYHWNLLKDVFTLYISVVIEKLYWFHRTQVPDSPAPSCGKYLVLSNMLLLVTLYQ